MITELIAQLTTLLARWDSLADESAQRVDAAPLPAVGGFYTGMMYGMETARDELAAALASAMVEVANAPFY